MGKKKTRRGGEELSRGLETTKKVTNDKKNCTVGKNKGVESLWTKNKKKKKKKKKWGP